MIERATQYACCEHCARDDKGACHYVISVRGPHYSPCDYFPCAVGRQPLAGDARDAE